MSGLDISLAALRVAADGAIRGLENNLADPAARVTQVEIEAGALQTPTARVTQNAIDAGLMQNPNARVSQYTIEAAVVPGVAPPLEPPAPVHVYGGAARCGCCTKPRSRFAMRKGGPLRIRRDRTGWFATFQDSKGAAACIPIPGAHGLSGVGAAVSALQSQMQDQVRAAAARYGVDPSLALAVARQESGFNPNAVSSAGAIGVMQLMPGTAADLGVDPYDPMANIDGGVRYLAQQLSRFGGNEQAALVAYNWGPANAQRWMAGQTGLPTETSGYLAAILGDTGALSPGASSEDGVDWSGAAPSSGLDPWLWGSLLLGGAALVWAATD